MAAGRASASLRAPKRPAAMRALRPAACGSSMLKTQAAGGKTAPDPKDAQRPQAIPQLSSLRTSERHQRGATEPPRVRPWRQPRKKVITALLRSRGEEEGTRGPPTESRGRGAGAPPRTPQRRRRARSARTSRRVSNKEARGIGKRMQAVEECRGRFRKPPADDSAIPSLLSHWEGAAATIRRGA